MASWALDPGAGRQTAVDESGSSLFTLGHLALESSWARLLGFSQAGLGLPLIALLVT